MNKNYHEPRSGAVASAEPLSLAFLLLLQIKTSLSVCQVARATGEAKCHGSKLHKEVTEIKVYWFVCLNTFKFAKSKNGLFET